MEHKNQVLDMEEKYLHFARLVVQLVIFKIEVKDSLQNLFTVLGEPILAELSKVSFI